MKYEIKNPILRGFHPDPCLIYAEGTYYLATSTFEYYPGVAIYKSKDLANWEIASRPLDRLSLLDMRGDAASTGIWAPDLSYYKGKFYLIFTNQKQWLDPYLKDTENYLTTAPSIEGPWSEPVYLNSSGFDPSFFHDEDGKCYMLNMHWSYKAENDNGHFNGILIQEYDEKKKKLIGKSWILFQGTERHITEGPHLMKKDGYYYLFCAEGGTGLPHSEVVARSKDLHGKFELHPDKWMISAWKTDCYLQKAGHASLCQGRDGEWVLAHLCGRPDEIGRCQLGRETAIQNMYWGEDGWPHLANGTTKPSDTFFAFAPEKERHVRRHYTFEKEISPDFLTLREPLGERAILNADKKGALGLVGGKSPMSLFGQSILARRVESYHFSAETALTFSPEYDSQMAGLMYRYSESNWHYLFLSFDEARGLPELRILSYDDSRYSSAQVALFDKEDNMKLTLKIVGDGKRAQFYYGLKGKADVMAGNPIDSSKLSDEYNRPLAFTGPFVGMACQDMAYLQKKALFYYFDYEEESD